MHRSSNNSLLEQRAGNQYLPFGFVESAQAIPEKLLQVSSNCSGGFRKEIGYVVPKSIPTTK